MVEQKSKKPQQISEMAAAINSQLQEAGPAKLVVTPAILTRRPTPEEVEEKNNQLLKSNSLDPFYRP